MYLVVSSAVVLNAVVCIILGLRGVRLWAAVLLAMDLRTVFSSHCFACRGGFPGYFFLGGIADDCGCSAGWVLVICLILVLGGFDFLADAGFLGDFG